MINLFKTKTVQKSIIKVFSFYKSNINPEIPKYQKLVFDKFGVNINQIKNDKLTHAQFLNQIARTVKDTNYIVFFDIDCVPTKKEWLTSLLSDLQKSKKSFVGAAQTANHLQEAKNLYVSPFFCGISTELLNDLNYPDATNTDKLDVWQNVTEKALSQQANIVYWWPTEIEEPKWYLHHPKHNKFGIGTTYNDLIYHAFYSREDNSNNFILKCKSILNNK